MTMCFEFCNQALITSVNCNQVSSDGYEIENLISNKLNKNNGFLCATFVKPPIEITIHFICRVELHFIRLYSRIGSQRSIGFELFSHIDHSKSENNHLLGKAFVSTEDNVCFINRNFRRKTCVCEMPSRDSTTFVKNISHHISQSMTNINAITIRIVKTDHSTVPCLKKLEIWAEPSKYLSIIDLEHVNKVIVNLKKNRETSSNQKTNPENCLKNTPSSSITTSDSSNNIPNEFLDGITHEIMTLPILLPSGNCIDQSTLDKYSKIEATWGRTPNDPFTGLPFHENQKPVVNSSLKTRIDSFLLNHEHLVKNLGRPTGHSTHHQIQRSNIFCQLNQPVTSTLVSQVKRSVLSTKSDETETSSTCSSPKKFKSLETPKDAMPKHSVNSEYSTHDEVLKESLSSSLKSVLSNLKSYTKQHTKSDFSTMCKCNVKMSEYKLPCSHTVCKSCLLLKLKEKSCICTECKRSFMQSDPVKIFL